MSFGSWRSSAASNPRLAGRSSGLTSSRVSSPSTGSTFSGSTLSRSLTQLPFGSSSSLAAPSVDQFITSAQSYTPSSSGHHRPSPFLKRSTGGSGAGSSSSGGSGLNSWNRASSISNLNSSPYSSQVYSSPSQVRSWSVAKPVSAASSSTSLNSYRSADADSANYGSTSMQSLDQIDSSGTGNGSSSISAGRSNGYSSSTRSLNAPISDSDIKNINSGADDIDYKKLCRQLLRENETLKRRIKELEEAEKKRDQDFGRERRSMQRTISEHEEELKSMAELKAENVKLKDDNAALIRVISKLSK